MSKIVITVEVDSNDEILVEDLQDSLVSCVDAVVYWVSPSVVATSEVTVGDA